MKNGSYEKKGDGLNHFCNDTFMAENPMYFVIIFKQGSGYCGNPYKGKSR
jgi:hypothetical protein